jgi:PGDYG protein
MIMEIDLSADGSASRYAKHEFVDVVFAAENGFLQSREGVNHYAKGDALIAGSTGDCWSVTRDRFGARYAAVAPTRAGENGRYVSIPIPVWAVQIAENFSVARCRGGDVIQGNAGDWLLQFAPADHGVVAAMKFAKVYRRIG